MDLHTTLAPDAVANCCACGRVRFCTHAQISFFVPFLLKDKLLPFTPHPPSKAKSDLVIALVVFGHIPIHTHMRCVRRVRVGGAAVGWG